LETLIFGEDVFDARSVREKVKNEIDAQASPSDHRLSSQYFRVSRDALHKLLVAHDQASMSQDIRTAQRPASRLGPSEMLGIVAPTRPIEAP
jgi:hypothetical protein